MKIVLQFVLLYLLITGVLMLFKKSKAARLALKTLSLPGIFFITALPFLLAVCSVIFCYGVIYLISIIVFDVIPANVFHEHFTKAVRIYLEITISSIVVAYYYDKVIGLWDYILFPKDKAGKTKFSLKILNQSRAKFSIYFLYFIALIIINTGRFSNHSLINSEVFEKAILESFGTFLAFERIISNWSLFMEEKKKQ